MTRRYRERNVRAKRPRHESSRDDDEESFVDLSFTPAEEAFRAEVRTFFADKLPARFATRERLGLPLS